MEGGKSWTTGPSTTTDAQGGFAFARVPREELVLFISGTQILQQERMIAEASQRPQQLVVEADRRCHFHVSIGPEEPGDVFVRLVDADGNPLQLILFHASGSSWTVMRPLKDGQLGVHAVSELAVELQVLSRDYEVIARVPVELTPGEVTLIESDPATW
jgi:hypothetical protein